MSNKMPIANPPSEMFALVDQRTMQFSLPELRVAGVSQPLRIQLTFDAAAVDDMLRRLATLRAQMLPAPARN